MATASIVLAKKKKKKRKKTVGFRNNERKDIAHVLNARVKAFMRQNNIPEHGTWKMKLKVAFCLLLFPASWIGAVFFSETLLLGIFFGFLFSQSIILNGFNVMHDAIHGALFKSKRLNQLFGYVLNMLGACKYFWKLKHDWLHHFATNILEIDSDLDTGELLRMSPAQVWRRWHRWQLFYVIPLYCLLSFSMILFGDILKAVNRKIGGVEIEKMPPREVAIMIITKLFNITYMIIIPMIFHPWWIVLLFYIGINLVVGLTLSLVFQLAHVVRLAEFPVPVDSTIKVPWVVHEIATSADFCGDQSKLWHRFITFYVGGLNYQVVHHLFDRICHEHYPKIVHIVKEVCEEFNEKWGTVYNYFPTLREALASHFGLLADLADKNFPPPEAATA